MPSGARDERPLPFRPVTEVLAMFGDVYDPDFDAAEFDAYMDARRYVEPPPYEPTVEELISLMEDANA